MRDRRLGGDAALDQPRRRGLLHDCAGAGATGQLRPPRHHHAELPRNHVEPLGSVFADHHHGRPAARAGGVLRRQFHLDARQVGGQLAAVGAALGRPLALQFRIAPLGLGVALGDRRFQVLEAELQLLLGQPLRLPSELETLQPQQ